MSPLAWAIIAMLLGLILVAIEVFIPLGGILGFLAFASLATAVVLGFTHSPAAGLSVMAAIIVTLPMVFAFALHWLPRTPMGRRVLLSAPTSSEVLPSSDSFGRVDQLVGQVGCATTKMLPSGAVEIGGRSIDAVSEGMAIEPGELVRVVAVRGNRVVVRTVEEGEVLSPRQPGAVDLSQSIDSLGLNPFEDPLA